MVHLSRVTQRVRIRFPKAKMKRSVSWFSGSRIMCHSGPIPLASQVALLSHPVRAFSKQPNIFSSMPERANRLGRADDKKHWGQIPS